MAATPRRCHANPERSLLRHPDAVDRLSPLGNRASLMNQIRPPLGDQILSLADQFGVVLDYPGASAVAYFFVRGREKHEIALQRRSAYLMAGESRNAYEHHIPAVTALRYSITFRTVRS